MKPNFNVVLAWTVCTLVASYGCRCGTLHNSAAVLTNSTDQAAAVAPGYNPFDPAQSPIAIRRARIDAIKSNILGKLGLEEVAEGRLPQPAANVTSEERRRAMQLYRQSVDQLRGKSHRIPGEDGQLSRAKQFFSFTALQLEERHRNSSRWRRNRGRLHIQFVVDLPSTDDSQTEHVVKSATLRLFKRRVRRRRLRPGDRLRVSVYQLLQAPLSTDVPGIHWKRLVDSQVIETSSDTDATWEEFNVLKAVEDWTENPSTNHGLSVEAELEGGIGPVRLSRVVDFVGPAVVAAETSEDDFSPTLSVMTRQRRRRRRGRRRRRRLRQRRSMDDDSLQPDCERGDGETRCCRYPLWVSFREIGWDRWILAPDGYRAYFCDGTCPPQHRVATHYAGIRALVNGIRPDAAPPPCCAATRMAPLTIAHYNRDGRAVVSVFDDMIVNECMCT